jgi:hypothetical protein
LRHAESIGPMCSSNPRPECRLPLVGPRAPAKRTRRKERALLIVRDEFRPAIPRSGCSPALPISASPARPNYHAPSPRLVKTGHFYFAENRTFLFCVDRYGLLRSCSQEELPNRICFVSRWAFPHDGRSCLGQARRGKVDSYLICPCTRHEFDRVQPLVMCWGRVCKHPVCFNKDVAHRLLAGAAPAGTTRSYNATADDRENVGFDRLRLAGSQATLRPGVPNPIQSPPLDEAFQAVHRWGTRLSSRWFEARSRYNGCGRNAPASE